MLANRFGLSAAPEIVDPQVPALDPAQLMHRLLKRQGVGLCVRIVLVAAASDHGNAVHSLMLRARRQRPRRRAAEQRDELAPPHVCSPQPRITPYHTVPAKAALCVTANLAAQCLSWVCAVERRRFPVGARPTRQPLQPEATGAVMEATKWLKPLVSGSRIGDRASVQAATRVNAEQASKRTMRRPTRRPFRGRLIRLGE